MEPQLSKPSTSDNVRFLSTKYGKNYVKLLHVRRDEAKHKIREIEVSVALSLKSQKDYLVGDNTEIIATDSQKNTVYALAKQYGVESIERFGILLCRHFVHKYQQVKSARVHLEQFPWRRIVVDSEKHVHAFVHTPESIHFTTVKISRDEKPNVQSGIRKFRIMKTTQSAFVNFVRDEFTSLPNMADRIFCTEVNATWIYNAFDDVDYEKIWKIVKDAIIESFAGPPNSGIFSPSVQQTIYNTQKIVLQRVPQIDSIEVELPNIHYYPADFSKLPALGLRHNDESPSLQKIILSIKPMLRRTFFKFPSIGPYIEILQKCFDLATRPTFPRYNFTGLKKGYFRNVFLPSEKPSGNIYARVERTPKSHL